MILHIASATERTAKEVGRLMELGHIKPAPYNMTESLCRDFISKLPNGGHTLNIQYRPWPVEVDLRDTGDV